MPFNYLKSSLAVALVAATGLFSTANAQLSLASQNASNRDQDVATSDVSGEFQIAEISVSGAQYSDPKTIVEVSGLSKNQYVKLPNDQNIAKAIKVLWNQGMFSDVSITIKNIVGNQLYLVINVAELPRLTSFKITGINNSQETELKEKMGIVQNRMVTASLKKDLEARAKRYFADKGFLNTQVIFTEVKDPKVPNGVALNVHIDKGAKVKINNINFVGNEVLTTNKLKRTMKGTKEMARISLYPAD